MHTLLPAVRRTALNRRPIVPLDSGRHTRLTIQPYLQIELRIHPATSSQDIHISLVQYQHLKSLGTAANGMITKNGRPPEIEGFAYSILLLYGRCWIYIGRQTFTRYTEVCEYRSEPCSGLIMWCGSTNRLDYGRSCFDGPFQSFSP